MKVQSFLEADFCYLDETKTDLETLDMYLALDIVLHIDSKDTSHNISLDICVGPGRPVGSVLGRQVGSGNSRGR